jgi:hypothetical protein
MIQVYNLQASPTANFLVYLSMCWFSQIIFFYLYLYNNNVQLLFLLNYLILYNDIDLDILENQI